ncbi:MAG TPA: ribulokinase [bacterium]|nr:ribulokinase [bacterium]HPR89185.1 ribulokinase [bacterium]
MIEKQDCVIGLDYGSDSVRALIVRAADGTEVASEVFNYPRWKQGMYCDPAVNRFRQHPLDYIEGLEATVKGALAKAPAGTAAHVKGISVDTTGSTPCAVDRQGVPLALTPAFAENPNAMFVLWKDHTAIREAEEINQLARNWGGIDYTRFEGGVYSSEWFWSKILHVLREDAAVHQAAWSWAEHCDWIPALLTGMNDPLTWKRSRCAAGHKAMWHESWGGLPAEEFLVRLDPLLAGLRGRLYRDTWTGDKAAGLLTPAWAQRLGLPAGVIVGIGAFDAHFGAVGAEIEPNMLVKVMGTSTCDMITTPSPAGAEHLVAGICGQVDGSILPGQLGLEAGQSGFGDIYAWFKQVLMWPLENLGTTLWPGNPAAQQELVDKAAEALIPALSAAAAAVPIEESGVIAVDWMNGRRTPDANQALKGAIAGINLGSDAPRIFRALVEATAFGARAIVDRFVAEGVAIHGVIGIGGVAKKSPFIMQIMADVLNMPIKVAASEQACALGSAMAAATAAGLYPDMGGAQKAMGGGFETVYTPDTANAAKYRMIYQRYLTFCHFIEHEFTN